MPCAFVLTNHLGCHAILMFLLLEARVEPAPTVTVLVNLDLFEPFLKNWRSNLREVLSNVMEGQDLVLLQKTSGVSL